MTIIHIKDRTKRVEYSAEVVELLEFLLNEARSGNVVCAAMVYVDKREDVFTAHTGMRKEALLIGAIETLKFRLMES